jgi:small subunit ribosomal protein S1
VSATDTTTEAARESTPDVTPPPAADLMVEVDGKLVPNYDATLKPFDEGDVVSGEVVRIDKDEVLVDIGYKSEGVIPSTELSIRRSVDPAEEVSLGERVDALVLTKEDQEGRLLLSKKRARFEKAWRKIEAAAESGEPVEGIVIEVVKGGLILDLGVRGFLPASLVDIRRVHNLDEFKGEPLECKVIELNRSRNNVVLSRRAVLEEERKEVREQILGRLQPGMVVEGKISNIVDFGAFVDLDGIDGLIHISELSWSHVNHPSEVLSVGETVRVKVLDIDRERQRISLGLKQTQEDPWQKVLDEYRQGEVLEGKVTKVVAFGAFVEIIPGVEGLVHISELAEHHVENPSEVVSPGDQTWVRILEIDESRRRISLSVKRAESQNMPLKDLMPPELTGEAEPAAASEEVPEPDDSAEAAAEPEAAEPEAAEPEAAEPEAAEPEAAEPEAAEPEAAEPEAAEPEAEPAEPAEEPSARAEPVEESAEQVEPEAAAEPSEPAGDT